jgi:putative ABC transport system permease protein
VSLVLLIGAGLVVRAFAALTDTDPGFKAEHVLTFHVSAPTGQFTDSARYIGFFGPLTERLRAIPGVRSVSMTTLLPIQNSGTNGFFDIVGRPQEKDVARRPWAEFRVVGADFLTTMGIPLKSGRGFTENDALGREPVVLVNEVFAKKYFTESVIGKQVTPWGNSAATIVGVVGAIHQASLEREPLPELYVPAAQNPWQLGNMTFVISTQADPNSVVPSVRAAVRELAPTQPLANVESMEQVISESLQQRKLTLSLLAIFAVLATVLSAAGVYGVMSYGVAQRTREIGIRMALGAGTSSVTRMVLFDAGRLVVIGVTIGLGSAWLLTRFVAGMLYGVGQHDPATFGAVTVMIAGVALLASVLPAFRAARIDPLAAMRVD